MERKIKVLLFSLMIVLMLSACELPFEASEINSETVSEEVFSETVSVSFSDEEINNTSNSALESMEESENEITQNQVTKPQILHFIDAWGEWHDTEILEDIEKNPYDVELFTGEGLDKFYEDDDYTVRLGIDVSKFQGSINWQKVKDAGIEFVFIRIGYRGYGYGDLAEDVRFRENIKGANEVGIDTGVYIFAQSISEEEAIEEAEYILSLIEGYEVNMPIVYDFEPIRKDVARTDDITGEQLTKNAVAFSERIREGGCEPMIYINMPFEAFMYDLSALSDTLIWYADYEILPQTPYRYEFWQFTNEGRVPGISGTVDLNLEFVSK